MNGRLASIVIAIAALLIVTANACFQVLPGNRAVVLQFGRIVASNYGPGLHFKIPFVQNVEIYDGRILTLDNQTQTVPTADKKKLEIGYYVKWKVADAETYYRAAGGQELVAMDRLSAIINRNLHAWLAQMTQDQVLAMSGRSIVTRLDADTQKQIAALGISVVDLRISDVHMPAELLDGVYERMRAARQARAADTRAQAATQAAQIREAADAKAAQVLAKAHLKAEQLRGQGDAEAAREYAESYAKDPKFFSFYRALEAYRQAFAHGDKVLVLGTDSPFFKYLQAPAAGK